MTQTTSTQPATFQIGDLVVAGPGFPSDLTGRTFRITKVPVGARGVNYTAAPVDSDGEITRGRGVRGPADAFTRAGATVTTTPAPTAFTPSPATGTIVTVTGIAKIKPTDLYVVLGDARKPNCTKIAKMFGSDGARYWPSIPNSMLTVQSPTDVATRLAALAR